MADARRGAAIRRQLLLRRRRRPARATCCSRARRRASCRRARRHPHRARARAPAPAPPGGAEQAARRAGCCRRAISSAAHPPCQRRQVEAPARAVERIVERLRILRPVGGDRAGLHRRADLRGDTVRPLRHSPASSVIRDCAIACGRGQRQRQPPAPAAIRAIIAVSSWHSSPRRSRSRVTLGLELPSRSRDAFPSGRQSIAARRGPLELNRAAALSPDRMDSGPTHDISRPDRRGAFLLLFFCLLAVGAGNTMLTSAVLPPLTRELSLPDWTAGAIFSLSAAIWVVTAPYWGAKSNVWGRRQGRRHRHVRLCRLDVLLRAHPPWPRCSAGSPTGCWSSSCCWPRARCSASSARPPIPPPRPMSPTAPAARSGWTRSRRSPPASRSARWPAPPPPPRSSPPARSCRPPSACSRR